MQARVAMIESAKTLRSGMPSYHTIRRMRGTGSGCSLPVSPARSARRYTVEVHIAATEIVVARLEASCEGMGLHSGMVDTFGQNDQEMDRRFSSCLLLGPHVELLLLTHTHLIKDQYNNKLGFLCPWQPSSNHGAEGMILAQCHVASTLC